MGENGLAVLPHPPILMQTISEEGALLDVEDRVCALSYCSLWPDSSMVPDGRGAQSTGCPVTWLLCLLFLYSQWIRAGLRLPIFFSCCAPQLWLAEKKKSPFFFFF